MVPLWAALATVVVVGLAHIEAACAPVVCAFQLLHLDVLFFKYYFDMFLLDKLLSAFEG